MTHNTADELGHPVLPDGHPLRCHVLSRIARRAGTRAGDAAEATTPQRAADRRSVERRPK